MGKFLLLAVAHAKSFERLVFTFYLRVGQGEIYFSLLSASCVKKKYKNSENLLFVISSRRLLLRGFFFFLLHQTFSSMRFQSRVGSQAPNENRLFPLWNRKNLQLRLASWWQMRIKLDKGKKNHRVEGTLPRRAHVFHIQQSFILENILVDETERVRRQANEAWKDIFSPFLTQPAFCLLHSSRRTRRDIEEWNKREKYW